MCATKKQSAIYTRTKTAVLALDVTNPRPHDEILIERLELSLKKLGLIMPIIAFDNGVILGGHQRIKTLRKIGEKEVYVNFIKTTQMAERISINMYLNRVIQEIHASNKDIVFEDDAFFEELKTLPDVKNPALVLKDVFFDDMKSFKVTPDKNLVKQEAYLYSKGLRLPVIIDEDNNIVVGKARAFMYRSRGRKAPVLRIKNELAPYVIRSIMGISNKFEFGDVDFLRTSSRRHIISNNISSDLMSIYGKYKPKYHFGIYAEGVKRRLGSNILDFGAGNGKQTALLRQHGVNITLFEPFVPRANQAEEVSILNTLKSYTAILDALDKQEVFTSVIANAVLNSVATKEDIRKVCYLLKFLSLGGTLHGTTRSVFIHQNTGLGFAVEDNTRISSAFGKLKIQNFLNTADLKEYFEVDEIKSKLISQYLYYRIPNRFMTVSWKRLAEAVRMEFDFYYTDRKLNIIDKALDVFYRRALWLQSIGLCELTE